MPTDDVARDRVKKDVSLSAGPLWALLCQKRSYPGLKIRAGVCDPDEVVSLWQSPAQSSNRFLSYPHCDRRVRNELATHRIDSIFDAFGLDDFGHKTAIECFFGR